VEGAAGSAKNIRAGGLNAYQRNSIQHEICKPMNQLVYFFGVFAGKKASGSNGKYKEFRPCPTTRPMHIAHTAFPGHLSDYRPFPPMHA
jgi:hypothetical protein